jgi:hypothetical protein
VRRIPDDQIPTFICEGCGKTVDRKRIIRRGVSRGFLRGIRFCSRHCAMVARTAEKKGHLHKGSGYRMVSGGSREAGVRMEHHVVMERLIGRPLRKDETVHHRNGIRTDNRPENLELWSGRHGKGHRVSDQIEFAKETLKIYGEGPFDPHFIEQGRKDLMAALGATTIGG